MNGMPNHRIENRRWRDIVSVIGLGAVVSAVIALALGLAAYTAAASYKSVSELAARAGVPISWLTPIGIDGGLLAVIIFDITLTIIGKPIRWLRMTSRLFAAGMVAANVAAGWPDPAGVGLRLAAPVLFIVIVEAARAFLLRRHDDPESDGIPRIRWLLDFRGTFALWRRMKLWGERSYMRAVGIELERIAAIEKLAMKYAPEEWAENAPADLVWMLKAGVRMTEALARVAELSAEPEILADAELPAGVPPMSARNKRTSGTRKAAKRNKAGRNSAASEPVTVPRDAGDEVPVGLDGEALILWWIDKGLSASQAGVKAGFAAGYGRRIARKYRELSEKAPVGGDAGGAS